MRYESVSSDKWRTVVFLKVINLGPGKNQKFENWFKINQPSAVFRHSGEKTEKTLAKFQTTLASREQ